jgi:predicted small metal-binding protein
MVLRDGSAAIRSPTPHLREEIDVTIELRCKDLGIADCDWTATGETPADVLEQAVAHLEDDHGLAMPEPEAILEGELTQQPFAPELDKATRTVVVRMQEALDIVPPDTPTDASPAIGKLTPR